MTAQTKDVQIPEMNGEVIRYTVKDSTAVWKGMIVAMNTSGTIEPAAANLASQKLVGIALEKALATETGKTLLVKRTGLFGFPVGSFTMADVGKPIYITDASTITTTAPSTPIIAGRIVTIESVEGVSKVFIELIHSMA